MPTWYTKTQADGLLAGKTPNLTTLPVSTSSVAPTVGAIQPYSLGGGSFAPALPALSGLTTGSTYVGVQKAFSDSSTNIATITCTGADSFDSGATSIGLALTGELRILQVVTISGTKYWKVVAGNAPLAALDTRYAPLSGGASTRTLNVISELSNPDSSSTLKQSEFLFRMPELVTFKPNRWRLRIANYNVFGGAAVPTGATFVATYSGPQAIGTDGAPTAAFAAAPTLALPGFTLPSDGSEYVSGWVTTAGALPDPKIPWLYSFAYTGGDTTTGQASGTGEAWTANTAGISANVGDQVARGNKGNTSPFDLRIEYEYTVPATTVYEMGIGDSLMGGAGPTFPKYKTWPQQGANRRNRLISNVAVGSTTLAQWSDNTRRLWTRFSAASAPDRVIIGLGTNDLNTTSLAASQAYFITILGLVRAAYPGVDILAMPIPPRNLPHARLAQYAPTGATSLIVNESVATGSFNLGEELFGETVTVSAVSGTGPFTLTVGATTKNHAVGEYLLGTKELQRTQWNTWLRTLPGKIQGVLSHDQVLAAPWNRAILDPQYVHSDNVHWSVAGLARAADLAG